MKRNVLRTAEIHHAQAVAVDVVLRNKTSAVIADRPFRGIVRVFGTVKTESEIVVLPSVAEARIPYYMR